jgi:hypothetical protein
MQVYDISIPVNGARLLQAPGRFFRYYSGSAAGLDETILVTNKTRSQGVLLRPGQSLTLPESNDQWLISNYANVAQINGKVVVGMGRIDDDRVTGEVSVISGEAANANSGKAGIIAGAQAAVAGQYSHVQLWNPSSTVNVIVERVVMAAGAACIVGMRSYNVALSTLNMGPQTKLFGAAAMQSRTRGEANASLLGTASANIFLAVANESKDFLLSSPIVLPPNWGLVFVPLTVNIMLNVTFQLLEEPV